MKQREIEELSRQDCFDLLAQETVGRLVYIDDLGPVAEPVNYAIVGETIVLRVEGGSKRQAMAQTTLAFEVDHIVTDDRSGWSIVIRGRGKEVPLEDVPALLHEFRQMGVEPPLPLPSGVHKVWLRITITSLSGRRLGRESSPLVF
jgi:nitroimidazol reductase NimA-like FMN-containing flavoprotein (pyridoxamine 5'-phosphate oxidase superfamily)